MKKVILIEDNPLFRHAIKWLFMKEGWEVVVVNTELELRRELTRADIVVSDYDVPNMCFEDTEKLCLSVHKPLILQTGSLCREEYPYRLSKPFSRAILMEMIKLLTEKEAEKKAA